jgi:hypothetical protein
VVHVIFKKSSAVTGTMGGAELVMNTAELILKTRSDRGPEPCQCDGATLYVAPPRQGIQEANAN